MTRVPEEAFAALHAVEAVLGRYGAGGPPRPLDVTLVVRGDVVPWRYPPTRAFAYGEWLRAAYEAGAGPAPGPHPDVAIALAQARAIGVALLGPPPREPLGPVPEADLARAGRPCVRRRDRGRLAHPPR